MKFTYLLYAVESKIIHILDRFGFKKYFTLINRFFLTGSKMNILELSSKSFHLNLIETLQS